PAYRAFEIVGQRHQRRAALCRCLLALALLGGGAFGVVALLGFVCLAAAALLGRGFLLLVAQALFGGGIFCLRLAPALGLGLDDRLLAF
ncbi:hypothetical protein, partial [Enterococcus faecium]